MANSSVRVFPRRRLAFRAAIIGSILAIGVSGCASGSAAESEAEPDTTGASSTGLAFNESLHNSLPEEIRDSGVLQVGVTVGDPPYMDKVGGEYVGVVPSLAEAVGTVLGLEVSYSEMPFPGLIPGIQANKIQVAWTSMFDNADREQVIDMVTYAKANMGIIVQKGNPHSVTGIEDLCGLTVGTTQGTVQENALVEQEEKCEAEGQEKLTLNLYATQNDAYTQAQAGVLDAVMLTYTPMLYQAANIEDGNAFDIVDWTSPAGYIAVGVSNTQDGLASAISEAILQLEASGDYQGILEEHGATEDVLTADEIVMNGFTSGDLE